MKSIIGLLLLLSSLSTIAAVQTQPQTGIAAPQTQTAPAKPATALVVWAPKNLKSVVREVSRFFERSHPTCKLTLRFGSTALIMRALESAAPADVFVVPDAKRLQKLRDKKITSTGGSKHLLSNEVVFACHQSVAVQWKEPKDIASEKISQLLLYPESQSLGKTSRVLLQRLGIFESVSAKITEVKDAKALWRAMKSGEPQCAFLFSSAATGAKNVKILWRIPNNQIAGEQFFAGVLERSSQPQLANQYVASLRSIISSKIFENAGYTLAP